MFDEKIKNALQNQVNIIDDILTRYVNDEAGEAQKEKYNKMLISDKINLLTNTLLNCSCYEDFEADIVINFDYNNY